jgi:hypothetical protein
MVAEFSTPESKSRRAEGKTLIERKADRRETRFAQLIAQGHTQARAYQLVSGVEKKESCENQGWRWSNRPAVQAEIERQRALLTEQGAVTRAEKRHVLSNIIRADDVPPPVKVSAISVDNRMTGDDDPFRKGGTDTQSVEVFVVRLGEKREQVVTELVDDVIG